MHIVSAALTDIPQSDSSTVGDPTCAVTFPHTNTQGHRYCREWTSVSLVTERYPS